MNQIPANNHRHKMHMNTITGSIYRVETCPTAIPPNKCTVETGPPPLGGAGKVWYWLHCRENYDW